MRGPGGIYSLTMQRLPSAMRGSAMTGVNYVGTCVMVITQPLPTSKQKSTAAARGFGRGRQTCTLISSPATTAGIITTGTAGTIIMTKIMSKTPPNRQNFLPAEFSLPKFEQHVVAIALLHKAVASATTDGWS